MLNSIGGYLSRLKDRLHRDTSAVAMVEFAFVAPIIGVIGFAGLEAANFAMITMRLNQAAVHVADNASRFSDDSLSATKRVYEDDINDLFIGVDIQAGEALELMENGRIILSSLEQNADGGQWIHWQRCKGLKNVASDYGAEGEGLTGTGFPGMGPPGEEITEDADSSVMFVEIFYTYQPIIGNEMARAFSPSFEMKAEAAFSTRVTRDLAPPFQRPATPVAVSDCATFSVN
ncbi:MAG: TadE family protein [Erythrobacter sp.]